MKQYTKKELLEIKENATQLRNKFETIQKEIDDYSIEALSRFCKVEPEYFDTDILLSMLYHAANNRLKSGDYIDGE